MAQNAVRADDEAPPAPNKLERVEVTGSLIKRTIDDEGALPVTVVKSEDLTKTGASTLEQALSSLSVLQNSGNGAINTANTVGASTGGQSTVSLRGLGPDYTLILLNGQRLSQFAYAPGSGDINNIPLSALDRVEVLRDGASAVYGTDAIGGVINFITKRNYQGLQVSAEQANTELKGGTINHFSATGGFGNLDNDKFNILASYNLQRQSPVTTADRTYALSAASSKFSSFAFPANYFQSSSGVGWNSGLPNCNPPLTYPQASHGRCLFAYATFVDLIPYSSGDSVYVKATGKLGEQEASLEYLRSDHHVTTHVAPDLHDLSVGILSPYYPGNGITPLPPASAGVLDPTQPIDDTRLRMLPTGDRVDASESKEDRLVATLKGAFAEMDYSLTAYTSNSRVHQGFQSGYDNDAALQDLIDGTNTQGFNPGGVFINPFGANNATQIAAMAATQVQHDVISAGTHTYGASAQLSKDLFELDGGPFTVSGGIDIRNESFEYNVDDAIAAITVNSSGIAPGTSTPRHSRNVRAIYVEALAKITKELEADLAVRTDQYDGFGSSTNPKLAIRYQPMKELLVRGSAATGFRAPDLYQLYQPQTVTNTAAQYTDPLLCPDGVNPVSGANPNISCLNQQNLLDEGNPNLKAEKSTQFSLGVVFQPMRGLTTSIDYWNVKIKDQVRPPNEGALYNNPGLFASSYVRCFQAPAALANASSACPNGPVGNNLAYVINQNANIGEIDASGIDFSASYQFKNDAGNWLLSYDLSYTNKYDYQIFAGGAKASNVGVFSNDLNQVIFKFQHTAALGWSSGAWSANLDNHFMSGYTDQDPTQHVRQYFVWNASVGYVPVKNLNVRLAVRNLLNQDPPQSSQNLTFQTGYNPYYGDPLGRAYVLGLSYEFK